MSPILPIPAGLLDAIAAHARSEHPRECCGFLTGPRGGIPEHFIPIPNAHDDPTRFYAMAPDAILAAFKTMDSLRHDPLVVYHSHINADSSLSVTDVMHAVDLTPVYLVCSLAKSIALPTFQAWQVADDENGKRVDEVALDIRDDLHPSSPLAGLVEGNRVRVVYDGSAGRRTLVAVVGKRGTGGASVTLNPVRSSAGGPLLVSLDRIRAVGVLEEGRNAAAIRTRAAEHLKEAALRLVAQDTVGARDAIGRAGALMPRILPSPPPTPRAYRPRRRTEV